MAENLDEAQITLARDCFSFHSKGGVIQREQLANCLRSLNVNPTMQEIDKMAGDLREIRFPQFIEMVAKCPSPAQAFDDVLNAFKSFDKTGSGKISADDLKYIMKNFGEGLTDGEMQQLMSVAGSGDVDYTAFVKSMLS